MTLTHSFFFVKEKYYNGVRVSSSYMIDLFAVKRKKRKEKGSSCFAPYTPLFLSPAPPPPPLRILPMKIKKLIIAKIAVISNVLHANNYWWMLSCMWINCVLFLHVRFVSLLGLDKFVRYILRVTPYNDAGIGYNPAALTLLDDTSGKLW